MLSSFKSPLFRFDTYIYSVFQQSDTNYYDPNQVEYQSHHGYDQEVMDAAYYNPPPVFLRQPVSHLMYLIGDISSCILIVKLSPLYTIYATGTY